MKPRFMILLSMIILSCDPWDKEEELPDSGLWEGWSNVKTVHVERIVPCQFNEEVVYLGYIRSKRNAEVSNHVEGVVKDVLVKDGDLVNKGDTLVRLESHELELALRKARDDYRLAEIEMQSLLLGVGSDVADSAGIPSSLYNTLKIQSGLNRAEINLDQVLYMNSLLTITAPFSGIVYDIKAFRDDWKDKLSGLCRLLDCNDYYVDFEVFETDLHLFRTGMDLSIETFRLQNNGGYRAKITSIFPVVETGGAVEIRARLSGIREPLADGTSARIIAASVLKNSIVVPKNAVVRRGEADIVFTYSCGRAVWNGVKIGKENRGSYLILDGLEFGDSIITFGNSGLVNNSEVVTAASNPGAPI
jgi:RND family efflux transporter MFP subunit